VEERVTFVGKGKEDHAPWLGSQGERERGWGELNGARGNFFVDGGKFGARWVEQPEGKKKKLGGRGKQVTGKKEKLDTGTSYIMGRVGTKRLIRPGKGGKKLAGGEKKNLLGVCGFLERGDRGEKGAGGKDA